MKRFYKLLTLVLALSFLLGLFSVPALAKSSLTAKVKQLSSKPYTYEITFSVEGGVASTAFGLDFADALSKGFSFQRGTWLLKDSLFAGVDQKGGAAALAFEEKETVSGSFFTLILTLEKKPSFGKVNFQLVYSDGKEKLSLTLKDGDFPTKDLEAEEKETVTTTKKTTTQATTTKKTTTTKKPGTTTKVTTSGASTTTSAPSTTTKVATSGASTTTSAPTTTTAAPTTTSAPVTSSASLDPSVTETAPVTTEQTLPATSEEANVTMETGENSEPKATENMETKEEIIPSETKRESEQEPLSSSDPILTDGADKEKSPLLPWMVLLLLAAAAVVTTIVFVKKK